MDFAKVSISKLQRTIEQKALFSRTEFIKMIISAIVGSVLAVFSSAIVNSTLVEITINGFFAIVIKKNGKQIKVF